MFARVRAPSAQGGPRDRADVHREAGGGDRRARLGGAAGFLCAPFDAGDVLREPQPPKARSGRTGDCGGPAGSATGETTTSTSSLLPRHFGSPPDQRGAARTFRVTWSHSEPFFATPPVVLGPWVFWEPGFDPTHRFGGRLWNIVLHVERLKLCNSAHLTAHWQPALGGLARAGRPISPGHLRCRIAGDPRPGSVAIPPTRRSRAVRGGPSTTQFSSAGTGRVAALSHRPTRCATSLGGRKRRGGKRGICPSHS